MLNDDEWVVSICHRYSLPRDKLISELKEFSKLLSDKGTLRKKEADFKSHFVNKKELNKKNSKSRKNETVVQDFGKLS